MAKREFDRNMVTLNDDWFGNNAAFTCPKCRQVFLVSGMIHRNGRECPKCGKSKGHVQGARNQGGHAFIEWNE